MAESICVYVQLAHLLTTICLLEEGLFSLIVENKLLVHYYIESRSRSFSRSLSYLINFFSLLLLIERFSV